MATFSIECVDLYVWFCYTNESLTQTLDPKQNRIHLAVPNWAHPKPGSGLAVEETYEICFPSTSLAHHLCYEFTMLKGAASAGVALGEKTRDKPQIHKVTVTEGMDSGMVVMASFAATLLRADQIKI